MNIPIYCINLARSKDRRKKMEARAREIGIDLKFVEAIDGVFDIKDINKIKSYDRKKRRRFFDKDLGSPHIGAMESHRKALNLFLTSQADYGVIIEDDVDFLENFVGGIQSIASSPPLWDIVRLYKERTQDNKMPFPVNLSAHPLANWRLRAGSHLNTKAIANMYTRLGAQKVLDMTNGYYLAIDRTIIYGWQKKLAVYDIEPPLVLKIKNSPTTKEKVKGARMLESGKDDKPKKWFGLYHSLMKRLWASRLALRGLRFKLFRH